MRWVQCAAAGLVASLVASAAVAQPAPSAPASGIGSYVTGLIEKACMPLIKGQDVKSVAQAAGLRRTSNGLELRLAGVQKIVVSPPTPANPTVCSMEVDYDPGQTQALAEALGAWAMAQTPPLPVLNAASTPATGVTSWSWDLETDQLQEGLVFNASKGPKGNDVGTVLFSRRAS